MGLRFTYEATDAEGREIYRGVVEAASLREARTRIRAMGLFPLRLTHTPQRPLRKVPLPELVILTEQLATMVRAGVPLVQALHTLSLQAGSPSLREALRGLRERIEAGQGLARAMEDYPQVFPPLMRSLVAAGELGGSLEVLLQRLAEYLDKSYELQEKTRTALFYPGFVLGVLGVVVAVLLVFVIPVFAQLYRETGVALPGPTQFLLSSSAFFRQHGWWLLLTSLLLGYGLRLYWRTPGGAVRLDGWLLRVPLMGSILLKAGLARFARTLGTLYAAGIRITEALEASRKVVGNAALVEAIVRVEQSVQRGEALATGLAREPLFLPLFVRMVLVGEEAGRLEGMLNEIAFHLEREVDYSLKRLSSSIEPVLTLILGGVVLVVALALYLPLFDLSRVIRMR